MCKAGGICKIFQLQTAGTRCQTMFQEQLYTTIAIYMYFMTWHIYRDHIEDLCFSCLIKNHTTVVNTLFCVFLVLLLYMKKMILLACWVRMPCGMKHPPAAVLGTRCCSPVKCVLLSFTPSTNICCNPHQPVIFGCELKGQIQPMYRNWVIYPS